MLFSLKKSKFGSLFDQMKSQHALLKLNVLKKTSLLILLVGKVKCFLKCIEGIIFVSK